MKKYVVPLCLLSLQLALSADAQITTLGHGRNRSAGQAESEVPTGIAVTACPSGLVDLEIYNGVSDVMVPDAEEETKGAVTVANLNDTDGDAHIDNKDDNIEPLTPEIGQDKEIDLIKLVLHKPLNVIPSQKNVTLTVNLSADKVEIWTSPNKKEKIEFDKNLQAKIPVSQLPKTLYLEAKTYSDTTRDIEVKLDYNGAQDVVKATAVWVINSRVWCTRDVCQPFCAENPKAGEGRLSALNETNLENLINVLRVSKDHSRFGHGYDTKVGTEDQGFGGRILFEYLIFPNDGNLSDLDVIFDCTRQKKIREMRTMHGKMPPGVSITPIDFPDEIGANIDKPNDDESSGDDEYNVPTYTNAFDSYPAGWRTYAWDRPGITNINQGQGTAFKVGRQLFRDFVRVNIGETFESGNSLQGSRVSDKIDWYSVYYTKSGANHLLEPDEQSVSASNPIRVDNTSGNGSCTIQTLANANNAGYKLLYNSFQQKWELKNANDASINTATPLPGSNPKKWVITDPEKVTVTIIEGNIPFGNGSEFKFSVFKTIFVKINVTKNDASSNPILNNGF